MDASAELADGDRCVVIAGTHSGKSGIIEDRHVSKTGHITITVREDGGARFKTLRRNVARQGQ